MLFRSMLGGVLMFVMPVDWRLMNFLLKWSDTEKMAWGILILFGGGLCLAQGLSNAGIIQAVGAKIAANSPSTNWLLFGLITAAVFITELMSIVALVQIFLPVVFGIATNMGIDPTKPLTDASGRLIPILPEGRPITELI